MFQILVWESNFKHAINPSHMIATGICFNRWTLYTKIMFLHIVFELITCRLTFTYIMQPSFIRHVLDAHFVCRPPPFTAPEKIFCWRTLVCGNSFISWYKIPRFYNTHWQTFSHILFKAERSFSLTPPYKTLP
jgi:hypothetical protein